MAKKPIHPAIKEALGYEKEISDRSLLTDWNKRLEEICKPCWELKYCPYGPLVEQFPLLPVLRGDAQEHHNYLKPAWRRVSSATAVRLMMSGK